MPTFPLKVITALMSITPLSSKTFRDIYRNLRLQIECNICCHLLCIDLFVAVHLGESVSGVGVDLVEAEVMLVGILDPQCKLTHHLDHKR